MDRYIELNDQKKKYRRTNNDLQSITKKTKNRAAQTPLKTRSEVMCSVKGHVAPIKNKKS
jgi:hypothetical protein